MSGIRVLVIDDSVLARKFLREAVCSSPDVAAVDTAPTGKVGLLKLRAERFDVVVLDIDMPEMDGLQVLDEIRRADRDLPVIMLSGLDRRGATLTVDALSRGANDFISKPSGFGSVDETIAFVEQTLVPRILLFGGKHARGEAPPPRPPAAPPSGPAPGTTAKPDRGPRLAAPHRVDLVVIGASTGGPNALETVLSPLPADLPVPVLVVQHMPAYFTKLFAERLAEKCRLPVSEAESGMAARRGIYVAPGDRHMVVRRGGDGPALFLNRDEPVNSCRPAVDVLFRSAAAMLGGRVLAVILTGMGQDGMEGCRLLRDAGASVIVQNEATSVVWGMPGAVAKAGLADEILPLDLIPSVIARRVRGGEPASPRDPSAASPFTR